ncbi:LytR/AlgR family response regulator transcription factor [Dinghuibacter silviterrae]|uniref:LytTR family two component transcriptional regulator n=1 Tax=Dinghuibacter silviterrae TaxID=1539049 RepID=A0A4V3GM38_9BACT|nr:LytTR family DNA-binding domain-containing protein [Dinghuibacter silviterrae]TDX01973.1 LytTR family two component transcriptional regulator [Dinghuibacter silviterrae]
MKTTCLIADDEPLARDLLVGYVGNLEDLDLKGVCNNAMETFAFLQRQPVQLLFLDIQMPKITGLDLIRSLHERPSIIITTAYREFAADGFELEVLDYLVKPISFDRFLKSVSRFYHYNTREAAPEVNTFDKAYMYCKVNRELVRIYLKDILYIESIKDYVRIVTGAQQYVTYQRIGYMEEKLPSDKFLRVHKSFIVSVEHIDSYNADTVTVGGHPLPLGRNYRDAFRKLLST